MRKILKIFFQAQGTRPFAVLVCLLLGGLAEGVGIATLLPALSLTIESGESPSSNSATFILDALGAAGLPPTLPMLVGLSVAGIVLSNILTLAAMTYVGYAMAQVATGLRRDLVDNLLNVRWGYFTQQPLGRITNALSVDATRAAQAYLSAATFLVNTIQAAIYTAIALFVSWKVALIALAIGGGIAALLSGLVRRGKGAGRRQTTHTAAFITYLSDALNNIKPLKAMARQNAFASLLDRNIVGLRRALRRQVIAKQALNAASESLFAIAIGVGFIGAVVYGNVPAAELAIIGVLLVSLVNAVKKIQREYQNASILESAYYNVVDQIAESAAEREPDTGTDEPRFERVITLEDVSFSHPRVPVLRDVSMRFPKGSITVLTGPSGAGKTTITDLLIGLRTPDSGRVLIDGRSLSEFSLRKWRLMVGYVPQELVLFHDTIFANIALGDPDVGEAEVREALRAAGALAFVDGMPDGLQTAVGEKGAQVSGGQRQRIALARALVKMPEVLILDEVTSALDPETERDIIRNIRMLRGRTTVISITHRAAFLEVADQIYELSGGRVSETDRMQALPSRAAD